MGQWLKRGPEKQQQADTPGLRGNRRTASTHRGCPPQQRATEAAGKQRGPPGGEDIIGRVPGEGSRETWRGMRSAADLCHFQTKCGAFPGSQQCSSGVRWKGMAPGQSWGAAHGRQGRAHALAPRVQAAPARMRPAPAARKDRPVGGHRVWDPV